MKYENSISSSSILFVASATIAATSFARSYGRCRSSNPDSSSSISPGELICPSKDGIIVNEPLSLQDQAIKDSFIPILLRFETKLDIPILKQGLREALTLYPVVAGRLDMSNNVYCIRSTDGVLFQTRNENESQAPRPQDSAKIWKNQRLLRLRPPWIRSKIDSTTPLCEVQITYYDKENVSMLAIFFNHCLGDANAAYNFIKTWSICCDKLSYIDVKDELIVPQAQGQRTLPQKVVHPTKTAFKFWIINKFVIFLNCIAYLVRELCRFTLVGVEFKIPLDKLAKYKNKIAQNSKEVEWVSSYEVIMGAAATALAFATNRKTLFLPIVINMRERTSLYKRNFFGNCVQTFINTMPKIHLGDHLSHNEIVSVTEQLHNWIRSTIDKGDAMVNEADHSNVREAGLKNLNYIIAYLLLGKGYFLNSWTNNPWLSMSMGSGKQASAMGNFGSEGLCIMLCPSTVAEYRLFIPVYPSQASKLLSFIEEHDLPFIPL